MANSSAPLISTTTRKITSATLDAVSDLSRTSMAISQASLSSHVASGDRDGTRNAMPYVTYSLLTHTSAQVMSELAQKRYARAMTAALPFISFVLMLLAQNETEDDFKATIFFNTALLFHVFVSLLSGDACANCKNGDDNNNDDNLILATVDGAGAFFSPIPPLSFALTTLGNHTTGMFNEKATLGFGIYGIAEPTYLYSVQSAGRGLYSLYTLFATRNRIVEAVNAKEEDAKNDNDKSTNSNDHFVSLTDSV